jgi:hypothetical protein
MTRGLWQEQAVHTSQGLFDGVFGRGAVDTSDQAWLQAMLDTEAALARALEQAGMAAPGAGAAVTTAAGPGRSAADLVKRLRAGAQPGTGAGPGAGRMLPPGPAVHQGRPARHHRPRPCCSPGRPWG